MNRKQRTTILIKGNSEIALVLAEQIRKNYKVKTLQEPELGLVMLKCRESAKKTLFYLGEVLMTECKVEIQEVLGLGIIKDDHPKLAYALAIIDAAYNAKLPETHDWESILCAEEKRIHAKQIIKKARVNKTRISFETMDI